MLRANPLSDIKHTTTGQSITLSQRYMCSVPLSSLNFTENFAHQQWVKQFTLMKSTLGPINTLFVMFFCNVNSTSHIIHTALKIPTTSFTEDLSNMF